MIFSINFRKFVQIYAEAESNANAKAFDWFIPQQTGDFMSHGCCGMGQAHKPSGLHCRGVNRINGRQGKYTQKPPYHCVTKTLQLPSLSPRSTYFLEINRANNFCIAVKLMPVSSCISERVNVGCVRMAFNIFV